MFCPLPRLSVSVWWAHWWLTHVTHVPSITWGSKIRVIWQGLMKTCSGSGYNRSGLNVIFRISPSHSQERADWCRGGGEYLDYKMDHICESILCLRSMRMMLGSIWNGSGKLSALSTSELYMIRRGQNTTLILIGNAMKWFDWLSNTVLRKMSRTLTRIEVKMDKAVNKTIPIWN